MHIQSPTERQIPEVVAISRLCYPERSEDARHWTTADPARYFIATADDGSVAGYGCLRPDLPRFPEQPRFRLHLGVRPDLRGRGIGRQLYDVLTAAMERLHATHARARVRHDATDALAFLERRGFTEMQRMVHLGLNVGEDTPVYSPPPGIEITTMAEARDHLEAVHELQNACFADIPTSDPTPLPTFADFERSLADPRLLFDAFFLARAGDRYVGLSYVGRADGDPTVMEQRMTGTHPEFRRRGIALALKARTVAYARQHGYRRIVTATNAVNTGMLAVNHALGFGHLYTEVRLGKEVG